MKGPKAAGQPGGTSRGAQGAGGAWSQPCRRGLHDCHLERNPREAESAGVCAQDVERRGLAWGSGEEGPGPSVLLLQRLLTH